MGAGPLRATAARGAIPAARRGAVLLAMGTTILVWGFAFVPLKRLTNAHYSSHPLSADAFLALRFVPLLPLLLVLFARRLKRERRDLLRRDWPWMALMGLLVIPAYHLPLNLALRTPLHTGLISLILNLCPALTYLLAIALGQERASRARSWGVALAAAGLASIVLEELFRDSRGAAAAFFSWEGAGWMAVSASAWTAYTLIGRRLGRDHDPQFLFAASGTVGTLAVLAACPLLVGAQAFREYAALGPLDWAAWGYVSLLSSFFAYWAWLLALTRYEASRLSSSGNLVPLLVHAAAAVCLPSERKAFTVFYLMGAAVTLAGTALVLRRRPERPVLDGPHGPGATHDPPQGRID
jgi:drug/metabolite transporter (DMT)-like permease